jgi:hypothetical protein
MLGPCGWIGPALHTPLLSIRFAELNVGARRFAYQSCVWVDIGMRAWFPIARGTLM